MKTIIFTQVLYFVLLKCIIVSGTEKCESKVEIRAVLIPCPPKDTGCDDDDPLSATLADEGKSFFKNKNSFKDYPSTVTECKRKMVITMKLKNKGKIPGDDEFIVVDHVYDPTTRENARLLSPVIIKLRQEQTVQLYGLSFQRIVNSNPKEDVFTKEVDESFTGCSVDSVRPTCGITTYDGQPIKFSEGFCCSCDPSVNAKRELSTKTQGEASSSKRSAADWNYPERARHSSLAIRNPKLLRLETVGYDRGNGKDEAGPFRDEDVEIKNFWENQQSPPVYFFEQDRRTVCSMEHILDDLCSWKVKPNEIQRLASENSLKEEQPLGKRVEFQVLTMAERKKRLAKGELPEEFLNADDEQFENLKIEKKKACSKKKLPIYFFARDKRIVQVKSGDKNETCDLNRGKNLLKENVMNQAFKNIQLKAQKMGKITNEDPNDILRRIMGSSQQDFKYEIRNKKDAEKNRKKTSDLKKSVKTAKEANEDLVLVEKVPKTKFGKIINDSPPKVVVMERVFKPKEGLKSKAETKQVGERKSSRKTLGKKRRSKVSTNNEKKAENFNSHEYFANGENVHSEREFKKIKRNVEEKFEIAKGVFGSEIPTRKSVESINKMDLKNLEYCPLVRKVRSLPQKKSETLPFHLDPEVLSGFPELKDEILVPKRSPEQEIIEMTPEEKLSRDKERLKQSYRDFSETKGSQKKKRDSENGSRQKRGGQNCADKSFPFNSAAYNPDSYHESAHCMRFSDLWYSVYAIKRPLLAQIVGVQLYDKHALCDGTTKWMDLTKGNMIRAGTFLSKVSDEIPTITMTFTAQHCDSCNANLDSIDPDNYRLLIPSHLTDPSKLKKYPQFQGGAPEYLLVDKNDISLTGSECNKIGTSFEAFAQQPERCSQTKGSCLKRQPLDLWREDMKSRIRGKRGKYFLENFGTVPNSPIKTYTNLTGDYLALEYYGDYSGTLEIEVKADYNAVVRKGANAQIPYVYVDSSHPKKTKIILVVLNMGLTSALFRPRLGDCPTKLDPSWCPLEGPLVTIAAMQRHDFKLDLSGILPANRLTFTVEVLNQNNKKIASRKILVRKNDRCFCAFHCRCNCVGTSKNYKCVLLSKDEYRAAGYTGGFPVRSNFQQSPSELIFKDLSVIFLSVFIVLLILGILKGLLGIYWRNVGKYGMEVIIGPVRLCYYYESDLRSTPVVYDECGFPVHPYTCKTAQLIPLWAEIFLNIFFFFLYPLRGVWLLMLGIPCCKILCSDCFSLCRRAEEQEYHFECEDEGAGTPLMNGYCSSLFNYNVQTALSMKRSVDKTVNDEDILYRPYKGDNDPLEEDDTEFVLQEMKRYQEK